MQKLNLLQFSTGFGPKRSRRRGTASGPTAKMAPMTRWKPTKKVLPVTRKQLRFVEAYIANKGNGTEAAMEAYDCANRNTAHSVASENLRKPAVAAEIERRVAAPEAEKAAESALREALQARSHWVVAKTLRRVVRLWRKTIERRERR